MQRIQGVPGWWTWIPASSPTSPRWPCRCGATPRPTPAVGRADRGSLRTLVAGQTVGNWRAPDDQTYDVNALAPTRATRRRTSSAPALRHRQQPGRQRPRRAPEPGGPVREGTRPNQINRRDLTRGGDQRQRLWPLGRRDLQRHPRAAGHHSLPARLPLPVRRLHQEHEGVLRLCGVGAGDGRDLHLHDPGQPVPAASCSRWR